MSVHHFACLWASRRGAGGSKQGVSDHMTTRREQAGRDASTAWDRRDLVPGNGRRGSGAGIWEGRRAARRATRPLESAHATDSGEGGREEGGGGACLLRGDELPDAVGGDDDELIAVAISMGRFERVLFYLWIWDHSEALCLAVPDRTRHSKPDASVDPHARGRQTARPGRRDNATRRLDALALYRQVRLVVVAQVEGSYLPSPLLPHDGSRVA